MIQKLLIIALSACLLASCRKTKDNLTVVRDCTGTYLRVEDRDYRVCNAELLYGIADGSRVKARFRVIGSCNSEDVHCLMLRAYEKDIHVSDISAY